MNVPQRITDYLRERRIRELSRQMVEACREGRHADARNIQPAWAAEIANRSPEQIARMEANFMRRTR